MPITIEQIYNSPRSQTLRDTLGQAVLNIRTRLEADQTLPALTEAFREYPDRRLGSLAGPFIFELTQAFNVDDETALREARDLIQRKLVACIETKPCIVDDRSRPRWFDENFGAIRDGMAIGPHKWWNEYSRRLAQKIGLEALDRVKSDCLDIVNGALEAPTEGTLLKKSLVVGKVQSGKTASMAGVIAMAADAGYNLFLILSGTKENLRRQTNARLFRDLNSPGAGLVLQSLTNAEEPGFTFGGARTFEQWFSESLMNPTRRALGVILKNGSRLRALADALAKFPTNRHSQIRCLVIDDEADEASINGGFDPDVPAEDQKPAVINGAIRRIVHESLPGRVAYLAYTATPFANILQEPPNEAVPNLYPETFIHHLFQPSDYIGFKQIHGDPETDSEGLNIICPIDESEASQLRQGQLNAAPGSLKQALAWFIAASAERICRTSEVAVWPHCSMLIHGSATQRVHSIDYKMVLEVLQTWRTNPTELYDILNSDSIQECNARVNGGYLQTILRNHSKFSELIYRNGIRNSADPSFLEAINKVLNRAEVIVDNAGQTAESRLSVFTTPANNEDAKFQIICGGNTLSRGLTIEGLVSSYFYRRTGSMDALMQMGRWCGYRDGYEDLPRIWMTDGLQDGLCDAVQVEIQLESQIAWMRRNDTSPKEYGIKLMRNPGGILLTRKMASAEIASVDYAGECPQTNIFENNEEVIRSNWIAGERLISQLTWQDAGIWRGVDANQILGFTKSYRFHPDSKVFHGGWITKYIEEKLSSEPFNVVLMSGDGDPIHFAGRSIQSVSRSRLKSAGHHPPAHLNIKTLRGPTDMLRDIEGQVPHFDSIADKMNLRANRKMPPLMLIYPIHKSSVPRPPAPGRPSERVALGALDHLLGVSFIFSGARDANGGVNVSIPLARDEEA